MQILNVSVMFMFHQVNLPVISTLVESMDELQSSTLFTNVSWHYSIRLCNISHSQISAPYTPKTRIQTLSNDPFVKTKFYTDLRYSFGQNVRHR